MGLMPHPQVPELQETTQSHLREGSARGGDRNRRTHQAFLRDKEHGKRHATEVQEPKDPLSGGRRLQKRWPEAWEVQVSKGITH